MPPRLDGSEPKHSVVIAQPVMTVRLAPTTPADTGALPSTTVPLTAVRLSLKPPQTEQSTSTNILVVGAKFVLSAAPSSQSKKSPDSPLPALRPDSEPAT